jgi:hypothetical protein
MSCHVQTQVRFCFNMCVCVCSWSNDDSISDDRNRRFRLGANHFLPAHYIQNAFLPVGCGHLPPDVLEPVTGAISIDPQRLLTCK